MNGKRSNARNDKYTAILLDFAVLCALFAVLYLYAFGEGIGSVGYKNFFILGAMQLVGVMIFMAALEEYSSVLSGFREQCVIFVLSSLYSWILVSFINLVLFRSAALLGAATIFAAAGTVLLALFNYVRNRLHRNEKKYPKQRLLIVETHEKNLMRMKRIKYGTLRRYDSWYEFVDTDSLSEVQAFIDSRFACFDVICLLDEIGGAAYDLLLESAMRMDKAIYVVPKMTDIQKNAAKPVRFDDVMTYYLPEYSLSGPERFLKRTCDLILAVIGTVFAAIPMGIIALAIKLTSPGPVFYKQVRLTKDKKQFEIYKFRTMVPDAEKLTGPVFATKDDPRITPIGKLLRACRLDELPQLLNILKGDMSVVGPRPERPAFVAEFEKEIEKYNYRFAVKAGLTSLSHVYGRYSTYIEDRTRYDLYYITHYSLLLDIKIILLTTKTMFLKSAAEGEDEFKLAGARKTEKEEAMP